MVSENGVRSIWAEQQLIWALRPPSDEHEERGTVSTDGSASNENDDNETDDTGRPEITVLVGNHRNAIYGIHGLAKAIVDLDEAESIELAIALRELSRQLYSGLGSLLSDAQEKIEAATGMTVRQ
jgi:hypothetical protein